MTFFCKGSYDKQRKDLQVSLLRVDKWKEQTKKIDVVEKIV